MCKYVQVNWDDARYFLAALAAGSFVAAGRELRVSHTTVSRRVTALEESLGVRLLERRPDGLVPTTAGEQLRASARRVESEFLSLERTVAGGDTDLFGALRVTAPYLLTSYLAMPHFASFCERYPHIELQIVATHALVSLTRRDADVAIRFTDRPPEHALGRRIGRPQWALYAHERWWSRCDAGGEPVRYIGLDDDAPVPERLRAQVPGLQLGARVNDPMLLIEAVRTGLGVGVLPMFVGDSISEVRQVARSPEHDVELWLLSHRDLRGTARVRVFLDYMRVVLARACRGAGASAEDGGARPEEASAPV